MDRIRGTVLVLFAGSVLGMAMDGAGAQGGALLFAPQDHCQLKMSGSYTKCKPVPRPGAQVQMSSPVLSQTEDEFLNSLQRKIVLTYSFPCSTSLPIDARLSVNGEAQVLMVGSPAGTVSWSVEATRQAPVDLLLSTASFNTLNPSCKLEVISSYALPQIGPIKVYAKMLSRTRATLDILNNDLSPNAETVELVASMDEGIERLESILLLYEDAPEIAKAGIRSTLERLTAGKVSITLACQNGSSTPLCTSTINTALGNLGAADQSVAASLLTLSDFLRDEVDRLEGVEAEVAQKLRELLDSI